VSDKPFTLTNRGLKPTAPVNLSLAGLISNQNLPFSNRLSSLLIDRDPVSNIPGIADSSNKKGCLIQTAFAFQNIPPI